MKNFNLKKTLGTIIVLLMVPLWAFSQNFIVKGTVKDASGEALLGVNISQVGTVNGTVSDVNGNFQISVSPNAKLQFSFVGYLGQVIAVGEKRTLHDSMVSWRSKIY